MNLLATAALSVLLQAPQAQQPKASIEGIVVRAGTNEPIRGARVTAARGVSQAVLTGAQPVAQPNLPVVTTDAQGRFSIKDLDPGTYNLSVVRNGFARQQYGERAPGRPGTPLNIVAGQALKDVVFRLVPAGSISGRVSGASGEPLAGFTVQVVRSSYDAQGRRTFQPAGSGVSDDRGEYRIYWITPGRYYVNASPGRSLIAAVGAIPGGNNNTEPMDPGYVVTYYPGTVDPSAAAAIELQPGTEVSTVDITLRPQPTFRIRGRLFDARTGQFPRTANVTVNPRNPTAGLVFTTAPNNYNGASGTFEVRDVAPGSYWLRAIVVDTQGVFSAADLTRNTAQIAIDVSNADVENVVLSFTPGVSIRGRVSLEDGTAIPNPERTRLLLSPVEPMPSALSPNTLQPDGTFTLENVQSGDYRMNILPMPPNSYIKSARLGQTDVLAGLSIAGPVSDALLVVLATDPGEIAGTVVDRDQKPVRGVQAVLIPQRDRSRRDLYRVSVTDQNGRFTIRGIPPGDYKLFAWEDLEPFAYNDPDFLRKYEERGTPVGVDPSSKRSVEAKVIPAGP